jgi:hypothetical protein
LLIRSNTAHDVHEFGGETPETSQSIVSGETPAISRSSVSSDVMNGASITMLRRHFLTSRSSVSSDGMNDASIAIFRRHFRRINRYLECISDRVLISARP